MNSIATAEKENTVPEEQSVGCAIEDGIIKVCAHGTREYVEQTLSTYAPNAVHACVTGISDEQAYRIAFALRTDKQISPGQTPEMHVRNHMYTRAGTPRRQGVSFDGSGYWRTISTHAS
jgi:hypothetical protein